MKRLAFRAMGSRMLVVVDSDDPLADRTLGRAPGWLEAWEKTLSRFREASELSRLNRGQGRVIRVSLRLWAALRMALRAARMSEGLVTPTVLPALEAAGYARSFDSIAGRSGRSAEDGSAGEQAPPPPSADWRRIECDPATRTVRLPAGVRIDLGGTAKGWVAERIARRLAALGPVLVDAGGDVVVSGPRSDGGPWPVAVSDPLEPDRELELLMVSRGGVATSGREYRRWRHDGVWRHHIVDPRTGRPAETDVLTATVVAPTAVEAEVAAKVALILGSSEGMDWIERRPSLAGLVVLESGRALRSSRLSGYLWT